MNLAQRRVLQEFETTQFPALTTQVHAAAGFDIPFEVNWESLAVPGEERLYAECWTQIYFQPLVAALQNLTKDAAGRDALKASLKKIVLKNIKGCVYGDCWATLADGVLTLDHGSIENAYDVDGRTKGLIAVLEQSL